MSTARPGRAMAVTTIIGAALLVIVAVVFTLGWAIGRVTGGSRQLHAFDESLRLTTVVRAQIGLAVHLDAIAEAYQADVADAYGASLRDAIDAAAQLRVIATDESLRDHPDLIAEMVQMADGTDQAVAALRQDANAAAATIASEDVGAAFLAFTEGAIPKRAVVLSTLADADEFSARLAEAARFLLVLIIPAGLVLVYREIAARQLRSKELEVRLDAERELAKARDEFVANASHELRTPLTAIYGLGQLLEEDESLPDSVREILAMMNGEAADLARMVEDLLTTARLAAGQLRFEPETVMTAEEADAVVQPFVHGGADIRLDVDDAAVWVDRLRQRQVLRNLISNAVKYGGGTIKVFGRAEHGSFAWTVADNGPGVPAELEERLFQRFVHTLTFRQAVAGGVGLGLSIVKSLAEGMGGSVGYQREGGWTEFIVRVPLREAASFDAPESEAVPA